MLPDARRRLWAGRHGSDRMPDFSWWGQKARFVLWHGDKAMLARVMSFIAVGRPVSVLAISEINEGVLSEIQGMQER
jgi:hypothetical protein